MPSPRKPPSRRGATTQRSRTAKKTSPNGRLPGWLWGLGGLVAGFFLAQQQHGTAPWQDASDAPQATVISKEQPDDASAEEGQDGEATSTPTFEFYTLLPETEIIASDSAVPSRVTQPDPTPTEETDTASDSTASQLTADEQVVAPEAPIEESTPVSNDDPIAELIAANTETTDSAETSPSPDAAPQEEQKRFMLQAASFRSESDAGEMRDRLRNLSLLAHISEVQANGDTWHRVQVGPYDDTRELNRAQDLMGTQGIEPLLIQLQN